MFKPGRKFLTVLLPLFLAVSLLGCNLISLSQPASGPVDVPQEEPAAEVPAVEEPTVAEEPAAEKPAADEEPAASQETGEPQKDAQPVVVPLQVEISFDTFAPAPMGPGLEQFPAGVSPLTGLPVRDPSLLDLPAVHASITNLPVQTRPQAGLSDAPHVFEIYTGLGMTRFLAVFHGEVPAEEPLLSGDFPVRQELFERSGLILGNQVWFDEDNNGIHDPNEYGIGGVGVSLFDGETRQILESTTSDSNGYYAFNAFPGMRYFLQFFLPPGFSFTTPDSGVDDFVDSDADPLSGLTPSFTVFFDDMRWDAGMAPVTPIRHLPEASPQQPQIDYETAAQDTLERLEADDVDASKVYEYENLCAILSGLAQQGGGGMFNPIDAEHFDLPMPVGEHEGLMKELGDAWAAAVAEQGDAIEERAGVLVERLQAGNLNLLHEARILMILLGGTEAVDLDGENGPYRILPTGEHADLMQSLVDAARDGADQQALDIAGRLQEGDWVAFGDAVRLTMFLREKRFLSGGELGGMLGITPLGENAQTMSALLYAAREGGAVQAAELSDRLNANDTGAMVEAEKLMMVLAENTQPVLDEDRLPLPEGPNADAMKQLGDAIRSARAYQLEGEITGSTPQEDTLAKGGMPGLMCPLRQDDPPTEGFCEVQVGTLSEEAVLYSAPDGLVHITFPAGFEAPAWQDFAQDYPDQVEVSAGPYGVMLKFQPDTSFLQDADGGYKLSFPGCAEESQFTEETMPALLDYGGQCLREVTLFADTIVSAGEDGGITFHFASEDSVELVGKDPLKMVAASGDEPGRTIELQATPDTMVIEREDGGVDVRFPPGMQLLQNARQDLTVRMPLCASEQEMTFYQNQFMTIGPTRSALVSQEQFLHLYTNSCLVYEGKSPGVNITGCTVELGSTGQGVQTSDSVGLDPMDLRNIAESSAPDGAEKPNYSGNTFNPVPPAGGQTAEEILYFYSQLNQSLWRYDPVSQTYLRFEDLADGSGVFVPALDKFTGRQTSYANLIVLYTQYDVFQHTIRKVPLAGGRGLGLLFRNGMMYPIEWNTKASSYELAHERMRPIKIIDEEGNPFPLQPGQSWYYVATSTTAYWELEDEPGKWKIRSYDPPGM